MPNFKFVARQNILRWPKSQLIGPSRRKVPQYRRRFSVTPSPLLRIHNNHKRYTKVWRDPKLRTFCGAKIPALSGLKNDPCSYCSVCIRAVLRLEVTSERTLALVPWTGDSHGPMRLSSSPRDGRADFGWAFCTKVRSDFFPVYIFYSTPFTNFNHIEIIK